MSRHTPAQDKSRNLHDMLGGADQILRGHDRRIVGNKNAVALDASVNPDAAAPGIFYIAGCNKKFRDSVSVCHFQSVHEFPQQVRGYGNTPGALCVSFCSYDQEDFHRSVATPSRTRRALAKFVPHSEHPCVFLVHAISSHSIGLRDSRPKNLSQYRARDHHSKDDPEREQHLPFSAHGGFS